jgi:hypothetical protein
MPSSNGMASKRRPNSNNIAVIPAKAGLLCDSLGRESNLIKNGCPIIDPSIRRGERSSGMTE